MMNEKLLQKFLTDSKHITIEDCGKHLMDYAMNCVRVAVAIILIKKRLQSDYGSISQENKIC